MHINLYSYIHLFIGTHKSNLVQFNFMESLKASLVFGLHALPMQPHIVSIEEAFIEYTSLTAPVYQSLSLFLHKQTQEIQECGL